ncbi:putative retrotransposon hot spot (RHS) protein [Trypanosoma rangeli]|uniref:Putative retrotransposon hot spot (RHS) protein n=1 Tax=Trypanosoma rangeli TaxID=5698 RepID=A0A3R7R9N2_TRYRA|nr:putative retrotransposon hot spot (RHS) protein [Trypanosoma rangeli]RNE98410.1 putative retrotransposon hot spot (RHS) protein [Trypanosoma rangeli]|eukprot:RNE98410.1 putative retrotransposon hot spot (RHS) protein [Trypanosoma rangeli]
MQMTTAGRHHTDVSKVRQLNVYLVSYFNDWEAFAKDLSWDIFYVQHANSKPIGTWQRCNISVTLSTNKNKEIIELCERVREYEVTVSTENCADVENVLTEQQLEDTIEIWCIWKERSGLFFW